MRVLDTVSLGLLGVLAVGGIGLQQSAVTSGKAAKEAMAGIATSSPRRPDKVVLSASEWKKRLTPAQFKILRASDTEPAFCGKFHDNHLKGTYYCAGCGLALFSSDGKFDSGTGWPSFYKPVAKQNVWFKHDVTWAMDRTEVLCSRCDGHLGHVFDDAPQTPTGLRYCINSDALTFTRAESKK